MNSAAESWSLHPQLARDTAAVGDLPLCQVLLMNDANYPWLILVPRRAGLVELTDLAQADRMQLMQEIAQAADALKTETGCDKINVAAIGNVVAQLHVHVVARFRTDPAWPKPVWGFAAARTYDGQSLGRLSASLRSRLGLAA